MTKKVVICIDEEAEDLDIDFPDGPIDLALLCDALSALQYTLEGLLEKSDKGLLEGNNEPEIFAELLEEGEEEEDDELSDDGSNSSTSDEEGPKPN